MWIVFWASEGTQLDEYMLTSTNEFRDATEKAIKNSLEKWQYCRQSIAKIRKWREFDWFVRQSKSQSKVKVKITLERATKAQIGSRGITTLSLTSALDGVGGQSHAPAVLPSGRTRYPLYRRLGGLKDRPERMRKISSPKGVYIRTN